MSDAQGITLYHKEEACLFLVSLRESGEIRARHGTPKTANRCPSQPNGTNLMSQVTFYLMSEPDDGQASAVERLACQLAADGWSAGHLYLFCDDEAQALRLDELLWQLPPDRFVPHQLQGESGQAPVEIGHQPPRRRYACLINLARQTPLFAGHFAQVVDFVPTDETQKQRARERYKLYRQAGHTLEMRDQPVATQDPAQP